MSDIDELSKDVEAVVWAMRLIGVGVGDWHKMVGGQADSMRMAVGKVVSLSFVAQGQDKRKVVDLIGSAWRRWSQESPLRLEVSPSESAPASGVERAVQAARRGQEEVLERAWEVLALMEPLLDEQGFFSGEPWRKVLADGVRNARDARDWLEAKAEARRHRN